MTGGRTAPAVIVLGGGTMGLASAWALARRGARVTVLERFGHVHAQGSHGGHTRIIRESYHEGAGYVPIVREAARLWDELSQRAGEQLFRRTGMLEIGSPEDPFYGDTIAANRASEVEFTEVEASEARRRWPFAVPDGWRACHSSAAGYLRVRPCMDALRREAEAAGAVVRHHAKVVELVRDASGVRALLKSGELVSGDLAVVAAGAYLPALLPKFLPRRLKVVRRVLAWTRPDEAQRAALTGLPVWCVFGPEGFHYGFPWSQEGVDGFKLACHVTAAGEQGDLGGGPRSGESRGRGGRPRGMSGFLDTYLPAARGPFVAATVCLYTCTPTWDFAIDFLPDDSRVLVAGGFSGHGFSSPRRSVSWWRRPCSRARSAGARGVRARAPPVGPVAGRRRARGRSPVAHEVVVPCGHAYRSAPRPGILFLPSRRLSARASTRRTRSSPSPRPAWRCRRPSPRRRWPPAAWRSSRARTPAFAASACTRGPAPTSNYDWTCTGGGTAHYAGEAEAVLDDAGASNVTFDIAAEFDACSVNGITISGDLQYALDLEGTADTLMLKSSMKGSMSYEGQVDGSCDWDLTMTVAASSAGAGTVNATFSGSICGHDAQGVFSAHG